MKCAIPTISAADLQLANSAAIGAEALMSISYQPVYHLADLRQTATDTGTLTLDNSYAPPSDATQGRDIQLVCTNSVTSSDNIVVTLDVTLSGGTEWAQTTVYALGDVVVPTVPNGHAYKCTTPGTSGSTEPTWPTTKGGTVTTDGTAAWVEYSTAVATIKPPAIARDQSVNLPQGIAVDFATPTGTQVRTILGLDSIVGGNAGNQFEIDAAPDASTYTQVAEITDKEATPPVGKAVAIPQRYNPAQWVKQGRGQLPKLTIKAKYLSYGDGLPRINGQKVTVMMETYKDDRILTERMIFGGCQLTVNLKSPDGDSEAEATAEGLFEKFAVYV